VRIGEEQEVGVPFVGHDVAEEEVTAVRIFRRIKFKLSIDRNGVFRLIPNLSPG
jgi:hypothetical protein